MSEGMLEEAVAFLTPIDALKCKQCTHVHCLHTCADEGFPS